MELSCIGPAIMTKRFKVILIDFGKVLKKKETCSHLGWVAPELHQCISVTEFPAQNGHLS